MATSPCSEHSLPTVARPPLRSRSPPVLKKDYNVTPRRLGLVGLLAALACLLLLADLLLRATRRWEEKHERKTHVGFRLNNNIFFLLGLPVHVLGAGNLSGALRQEHLNVARRALVRCCSRRRKKKGALAGGARTWRSCRKNGCAASKVSQHPPASATLRHQLAFPASAFSMSYPPGQTVSRNRGPLVCHNTASAQPFLPPCLGYKKTPLLTVNATVGTVCPPALVRRAVDLSVRDDQRRNVEVLHLGVGLGVLEEVQDEAGALLGPATLRPASTLALQNYTRRREREGGG